MKKQFFFIFFAIILLFTGCFKTDEETEEQVETIDVENLEITFDTKDLEESFVKENSFVISFNGTTAEYEKGTLKDSTFTISEEGTYYLTGNFNGNLVIDSDKYIRLIFDNVTISSTTGSPIFIKNSKKMIITLAENSINTLIDTSNYTLDSNGEPNATLFSKEDLTINGTGTLKIKSNYNDGIASKDGLKIVNGNFEITSVGDAIRGKDYIFIKNGTFNINSEKDGIKTTNEETNMGNLIIENGIFNIVSKTDGIDSQNSILISNGTFDIVTNGGSSNSSEKSYAGMWNNSISTSESSKGIKAGSNILIENGNIKIDSSDDSIHSNNIIEIKNGIFNISSGDDGIHADTNLKIYDGTINIDKSYEGLESSEIYIYNGTIYVNASDDGINVAGGADSSSMNGRPGQNNMSKSIGKLEIENGYIYVDAQGDGLDANGSIYIKDGYIIVNGPTNDGNGIFDYDSEFVMTGGTLIGVGSSGMLQTPSLNSTINTISVVLNSYTDSLINITDSENNSIITFKSSKKYNSFVYASSSIKKGETYNINTDGEVSGYDKDGIYEGTYKNGTLLKTITVNSTITSVGDRSNNMQKPQRR